MTRFDWAGLVPSTAAFEAQVAAAADYFHRQGYVILDNVLPAATMAGLNAEFLAHYQRFLKDEETDEVLQVGGQRYMLALRFAGGFADPGLFANPAVVAVVRAVLDTRAILEAYGAILSLPGSEQQHEHKDGPDLFGMPLSAMLPAYALTAGLPLIEMNDLHGTTAIRPGSHRRPAGTAGGDEEIRPVVPPGSCMMWDFRTRHRGTPNASAVPRPMLYCTYSRPWFRDPVNFQGKKQLRRLEVDDAFRAGLPADVRALLDHP